MLGPAVELPAAVVVGGAEHLVGVGDKLLLAGGFGVGGFEVAQKVAGVVEGGRRGHEAKILAGRRPRPG